LEITRRKMVFMVTIIIFIKYLLPKYGNKNINQIPLEEIGTRRGAFLPKSLFLLLK
jgi:hypothetical protein